MRCGRVLCGAECGALANEQRARSGGRRLRSCAYECPVRIGHHICCIGHSIWLGCGTTARVTSRGLGFWNAGRKCTGPTVRRSGSHTVLREVPRVPGALPLGSNAGLSRSGEGCLSPTEGREDGKFAPITEGFVPKGACPPRIALAPVSADCPGLGSCRNSPSCWRRRSSRTHHWSCTLVPRCGRGASLLNGLPSPSKRK